MQSLSFIELSPAAAEGRRFEAAPAVTAADRERERLVAGAVLLVCLVGLTAAIIFGMAMAAAEELQAAGEPAACRVDAGPEDYPAAWVEEMQ